MKKYLVRTTDGKWDEVTEYVFTNRKWATNPNGEPRYGSNPSAIIVSPTSLEIHGEILHNEVGKLMRYLRLEVPMGSYPPIVQEPETIQIVKGGTTTLHVLKTGENWTKRTPKKVTEAVLQAA